MIKQSCVIYIVRHGQSEANAQKMFGFAENPLTKKGKEQAKLLEKTLHHIHFDKIYSSTLTRAIQTAEIIAKKRGMSIKSIDGIQERDYGKLLMGRTYQETNAILAARNNVPYPERRNYKISDDYENDNEVVARVFQALQKIANENHGRTILIVSHVAVMKLILIHLKYIKQTQIEGESIENTGYIELNVDGENLIVKEVRGIKTI